MRACVAFAGADVCRNRAGADEAANCIASAIPSSQRWKQAAISALEASSDQRTWKQSAISARLVTKQVLTFLRRAGHASVRLAVLLLIFTAAEGFAVPRTQWARQRGRASGWTHPDFAMQQREDGTSRNAMPQPPKPRLPLPAQLPSDRRAVLGAMVLGQWLAAVAPAASDALFDFDSPTSVLEPALLLPGGAVRSAQRAAADEEDTRPQKVGQPRALGMHDAEAFYQLTRLQGWVNTIEDLQLLLSMEGSRSFGIFSGSAQLVAVCACTHLPGGGGGAAWLSYVITRKDFRRRGLARQTCTAALEWLDGAYPGCPIGLYGEPTKAAPLYTELGFKDVGNARFWSGSFSADTILAADTSSSRSANGKLAVYSRVRAITVGGSTALKAGKGSVLLESLLIGDERVLGCSRAQALRAWQKETPFLSWEVPDVDRALVARIFGKFCDKTSGKMMYQGLRDLNLETVGIEVQEKEYEAFCRRVGVSPADGFSEDALFEIYAQPGNSVTYDASVVFGGAAGPRMQMAGGGGGSSPPRGWVLGRRTAAAEGSGYFIGPLVARDAECATALLIAALRGAAVDHKLRDGSGQFKVELLGVEAPGMPQAEASLVLESLGFKAGGLSRYMVRGSAGKIYPEGGSRIIAASSFEYA